MSIISTNGQMMYLNDVVSHIRDSMHMDVYPEERLDGFLALDTNNTLIHFVWKNIFQNSTYEENLQWFQHNKLKSIFLERINKFVKNETQKQHLINIVSNNINDSYKIIQHVSN